MRSRSIVLSFILMATFVEEIATAQSPNGYVIGGVGSYSSKLISQAAIGGEVVFGKGLGAGSEVGFIAGHDSFGFLSLNGYYHFVHNGSTRKLDPFLTGGYTLAFDPLILFGSRSHSNGANIGLGLSYWFCAPCWRACRIPGYRAPGELAERKLLGNSGRHRIPLILMSEAALQRCTRYTSCTHG